jgi:exosortase
MDQTAAHPTTPSAPGRAWPLAVLALLLFGAAYSLTLHEIFTDWVFTPTDFNYYSHGPLVVLVAAVFVYLRRRGQSFPVHRREFATTLGLLIMVGSLLFHVVASYAEVRFASGFSIISAIAGWVLWMWGWPALRRFWFPIFVLIFAVPLPEVAIATVSANLKFFAANQAVALTNALGVPAVQPFGRGSYVFLSGDKQVVVGDVCSGLRSLISLLFFGAVYVYICRARGWRRLALLLAVFPIAIISNIIRITATLIVTHLTTVQFGTGPFHEWMGLGLFILAFMLMFGLERFLLSTQRRSATEVLPSGTPQQQFGGRS